MTIHTANVLGIFTDPFEFEGDYGPEVNPIRKQVFERVVSKEALAKNLSNTQVKELLHKADASEQEIAHYRHFLVQQAMEEEKNYGPTVSELVSPEIIDALIKKQVLLQTSGFTKSDLQKILHFLDGYKEQKIFHFLRNNPSELLRLDKALRDQAARDGLVFDLPLLSSPKILEGNDSATLKKNLLDTLFVEDILAMTKPQKELEQVLQKLPPDFLKNLLGENANTDDLQVFSSPAGQVFFFWLYQALNLHLISADPVMIEQVNTVKSLFAQTLGNPMIRAQGFKDKLLTSDSSVVFTQECDAMTADLLIRDGLFLPIDRQNPLDGTLVFLRSDMWDPNYEVITIEEYEGASLGRINVVLAKRKDTAQTFLLASCHGHSIRSADARLQIKLIVDKFHELSKGDLQLLIGIDANTKTKEDVKLFRELLDNLGLVATHVGPTTIKQRMVTAQHGKAGRFAIDEEDYLITLKLEAGGLSQLTHPTIGFQSDFLNPDKPLPNIYNPSDHYAIGATLAPVGKITDLAKK